MALSETATAATQLATSDSLSVVWQIVISIISGAVSGFAVVAFRMGRYAEKVDQLEKCDIQKRLSHLEGEQDARKDMAAFLQTKSPLSYNEKGQKLLEDSRGKDYVDSHLEEMRTEVKSRNPKSAYDVQEMSMGAIKTFAQRDDFVPLKNFIFQQGISLDTLAAVMGIYLRDHILPQFGYSHDDIDRSAPIINQHA